jgi:D-sedoheptulose 7-phosphate isomerase
VSADTRLSLPFAILCGGLGTRMRPATLTLPKPMLEVAGEPFLGHLLRYVAAQGGRRAVLCIGYKGDLIREFAGDGTRFGLELSYVEDGPLPLGTAGAVNAALAHLGDAFFVLFGDAYLPIDYRAVEARFLAAGTDGLMTVYADPESYHAANVEVAGGRVVAYDKVHPTQRMTCIDYGLSAFRAAAFAGLAAGVATDLGAINRRLIAAGQLEAFEVQQRFYEIGSPEGMALTTAFLRGEIERVNTVVSQTFSATFLAEAQDVIAKIDVDAVERMVQILAQTKARGGRLFILGVGGSAGNASHAVNDFRKIVGIEAYAPTDNVSELTARTNDEGWASVFIEWLKISRLRSSDTVCVFSVGGGNLEKMVSPNLVHALRYAKDVGASIVGIVGRDGGFTATVADACVVVPTVNPDHVTPHSEAFQAVIWHLIVSHPALKAVQTKWESVAK